MSWDGTLSSGGIQKHGSASHTTTGVTPGFYNSPFGVTVDATGVATAAYQAWSATPAYPANTYTLGSDSRLYKAVISNTSNDPTTDDGTNWICVSIPLVGVSNGQVAIWNASTGQYEPGVVPTGSGLPVGTDNQIIVNDGTTPYVAVDMSGDATIVHTGEVTVAKSHGNAFPSGATVKGDLWHGSNAATLAALPGNTTTTKKFLTETGTGSAANAPAWSTIAQSDVLPPGTDGQTLRNNGGTWEATSFLQNTGSAVQVGTGTPAAGVEVSIFGAGGNTGNSPLLWLEENASGSNAQSIMQTNAATGKATRWGMVGSGNDFSSGTLQGDVAFTASLGNRFFFVPGSAVCAVLDATGLNVGGTGTPGARIDVTAGSGTGVSVTGAASQKVGVFAGTTGAPTIPVLDVSNNAAGLAWLTNSAAPATSAGAGINLMAGQDPTASGHGLGSFSFGRNVAGTISTGAQIRVFAEEDWSGGNRGAYISFATQKTGGAAGLVNRVWITGTGTIILNKSGSAVATNATDGFVMIPNCAGVPTGTPSATSTATGATNVIYDATHGRFMAYNASAWTDPSISVPVTLTDAATIVTDASLGKHFRVTLGGNRTIGAPTNPTDGQKIIYEIIQDGTGSRTLSWNAIFAFGSDVTSPTLTTTASKRDFVGFVYNAAASKWFALAVAKGY